MFWLCVHVYSGGNSRSVRFELQSPVHHTQMLDSILMKHCSWMLKRTMATNEACSSLLASLIFTGHLLGAWHENSMFKLMSPPCRDAKIARCAHFYRVDESRFIYLYSLFIYYELPAPYTLIEQCKEKERETFGHLHMPLMIDANDVILIRPKIFHPVLTF